MKKGLLHYFFFCILIFLSCFSKGQNQNIVADSLTVLLKSATDTTRVNLLNDIAYEYISDAPEKASKYANEALQLAKNSRYIKGEIIANNNLGLAQYYSNNYDNALEYYNKVFLLARESGDKLKEASAINNIGLVYDDKADYNKALENYLNALQIAEKINGKRLIASTTNNIALIYQNQGKYDQALAFHQKALKIKEEIKNTKGVGNSLHNIGLVYKLKGDYEKSLEYYFKALVVRKSVNDANGTALTLNNIGSVYESMKQFDKARTYFEQSLEIHKTLKDQYGLAITIFSLGSNYFNRNQFEKGFEYMNEAIEISKKIGARELLKKEYQAMAEGYAGQKNFSKAYEYQQLFINVKDSILNSETEKQINELQTKYETEKKQKEIELITKNNEIQALELNKNKLWMWMLVATVLLILSLTTLLYSRYQIKQKANLLLKHQNNEITQQKKEITDSINYAKRIQESILPLKQEIKDAFSESFVFFKPRNVVSGDFYWFAKHGSKKIIACVDCTGHGVPGAFMSMIGNTLLNEIVNEKNIYKPSEILNLLHERVRQSLKQDIESNETRDGMDIALCVIDDKKNSLAFAGANRSLYVIRKMDNGTSRKLIEIKPDKVPIGGSQINEIRTFTNNEIEINKGDSIYMSTDGYADQFGGEKGKKFMVKRYLQTLMEIQNNSMEQQAEKLEKIIENWQGNLEQVDDILVIGLRV